MNTKHHSYELIAQDMIQLQQSMTILHDLVHEQQPQLDSIEDKIHESKQQVNQAIPEIEQATTYRDYMMYLVGGIGTVLLYLLI